MDDRITLRPQIAHNALYKALDRLIQNRIIDRAFTDQEDAEKGGYFSTLEGLEGLLVPFNSLAKNDFWEPLKQTYPELIDLMVEDIKSVLDDSGESQRDQQGKPYFIQGRKDLPYWTSECSSFTISVLTNFLNLRAEFGVSKGPTDESIIEVIKRNVDWIECCKRDKGWAWISDCKLHHPWPTWSLIDTFEEVLDAEELLGEEIHDIIDEQCGVVVERGSRV